MVIFFYFILVYFWQGGVVMIELSGKREPYFDETVPFNCGNMEMLPTTDLQSPIKRSVSADSQST